MSKKLTYESLLTNRSRGLLNPVSVGLAADSSDPRPAFRFKCSLPRIDGSFRLSRQVAPVMLWVAESLSITLDVRPNAPQGPDGIGERNIANPMLPNVDQRTFANPTLPFAGQTNVAGGGSSGSTGPGGRSWWQSPFVLCATAAVIAGAVLASNVITWGAETEVDPAAFKVVAGLLRAARQ